MSLALPVVRILNTKVVMGVLSQIGSRGQTVYSFGADSLALVPNCSGPRCLGPNCLGLILPGAHWITTGCWQIGPGQSEAGLSGLKAKRLIKAVKRL